MWDQAPTPAAQNQPLLKGSTGFMKCALLPKGSCLITGPSAVDNSSVFMVMTEESNLQPVAGKFRATQGWLGRRAGFIDGLGSWRLCGRNLVNGSLGPLPPDSAISPYSPASAPMVSFFFSLCPPPPPPLSFGVNVGVTRAFENAVEGKVVGLTQAPPNPFPLHSLYGSCPISSGVSFSVRDRCKRRLGLRAGALTTQSHGLASKVTRELLMGSSPIGLWCCFKGAKGRLLTALPRSQIRPCRNHPVAWCSVGKLRLPAVATLCNPNCTPFSWER